MANGGNLEKTCFYRYGNLVAFLVISRARDIRISEIEVARGQVTSKI